MKSLFRALFVLMALLVAFAPAAEAQDKKIPPGMYDLVADANYSGGFDVTGVVVEFTATTMTATAQGQLLVKSKISISGEIMTVEDLEGQVACPGIATFKLVISDKGIRMSPIEDPCAERSQVLAQVTMVKKM